MTVYKLTDREQEITRLMLQSAATAEIAECLVVSAHPVQQHFKSIFDKMGVRSRREFIGEVFVAHYRPLLHDNERHAIARQRLRGVLLSRLQDVRPSRPDGDT